MPVILALMSSRPRLGYIVRSLLNHYSIASCPKLKTNAVYTYM
jgi:hypothetical protein